MRGLSEHAPSPVVKKQNKRGHGSLNQSLSASRSDARQYITSTRQDTLPVPVSTDRNALVPESPPLKTESTGNKPKNLLATPVTENVMLTDVKPETQAAIVTQDVSPEKSNGNRETEAISEPILSSPEQKREPENTSGMGVSVPQQIAGFNPGAFGFTWIWGFSHGVHAFSVIAFVSVLHVGLAVLGERGIIPGSLFSASYLFMALTIHVILKLVFGVQGNRWGWRARRFNSLKHFLQVQKIWANWFIGYIIFGLSLLIMLNLLLHLLTGR
jgi:hypothetical protein